MTVMRRRIPKALKDLDQETWEPSANMILGELWEVERDTILSRYRLHNYNAWQTAKSLGIAYRTLLARLVKYGASEWK